jgi:two-component system sensor histidine kinase HydH
MAAIFFVQHRRAAEVRALEAEMERRERLASLGNMAAGVAHEIRNPLNAVSMGLQRLRAEFEPADPGEYRALVDVVQGGVRRLNTIVEDFLSLARPLSLDIQPVEVPPLLHELRGLLEGEAAAAGVALDVQVESDALTVAADRGRLTQVLLNLALNAIQATPRGGSVTLAASRARDAVALAVADTGAGIAPEVLPRLFEPYVTTKVRGLGLGLAIARRIAEAHGGRIEAESRAEGGTRFTVTLPPGGPRRE